MSNCAEPAGQTGRSYPWALLMTLAIAAVATVLVWADLIADIGGSFRGTLTLLAVFYVVLTLPILLLRCPHSGTEFGGRR